MGKRTGHWGPKMHKIQRPKKAATNRRTATITATGRVEAAFVNMNATAYLDEYFTNLTGPPTTANRTRTQQLYDRIRAAAAPPTPRVTAQDIELEFLGESLEHPF